MNIWEWVTQTERKLRDEGHHRLAEIMDRVPSMTCDDHHEEVEALVPEGVALAKQLELPWVELFLRHWHMQSAILHQYDVKERLPQAIELLEFAHRDHNRDCPQSVCTTQDVAVAYGLVDGKGYAQERLDVSRETLDRITPTWPCFRCISAEHANALIAQERYDDAITFLDTTVEKLKAHQRRPDGDLAGSYTEAYLKRDKPGDLERALKINEEALDKSDSDHRIASYQLDQARILAKLNRPKEAIEQLPPWETIWSTAAHYYAAADAIYMLVNNYLDDPEQGIPNSWRTGRMLNMMAMELARLGVWRKSTEIALNSADLAIKRRRPTLASLLIQQAAQTAQQLRDPRDFAPELDALRDRLSKLRQEVPEPNVQLDEEDDLMELLSEDPELSLEFLEHVVSDRADVVREQARALEAMGFATLAIERLEHAIKREHSAPDPQLILALDAAYQQAKRVGSLKRFLLGQIDNPDAPDHTKALCHWLMARHARDAQDHQEALSHLNAAQRLDPDQPSLRPFKASLLVAMARFEEALEQLNAHIESEHGQDTGPWDWDRMSVAALLGRWDLVRQSSARLGWELPDGDGPIVEPFGICRIVFSNEPDHPTYWAERLSPVTARILSVAAPEHPQHLEDTIVFDAEPLNPKPEDHPEDEPYYYHYKSMGVIEAAGYQQSYAIDGLYPGDEQVEALEAQLKEIGGELRILSSDNYRLHQEDGSVLQGFYAYLALSKRTSLSAAHQLLESFSKAQEHPLFWPSLLRDLQSFEQRDAQLEAMASYGIDEN